MRILPALLCCAVAISCGGESVSPEELDFRVYEVPFEDFGNLPRLEASESAGTVHLTGILPLASCVAHALLDASRDGNEITLVLHLTFDPNSNCPQEGPLLGYEAFVRDVEHGTFSAATVYTSQLQHRTSGGSVTIDVP